MPAYSELKRRLGFGHSGMVLHRYYFGNLTKDAVAIPSEALSSLKRRGELC
jgi:Fe-Mn family superoxide dismutase